MDKVNLIYGAGDVLHTHLNINPFAEEELDSVVIRDDIFKLDKYVDDGELEEIIASDVIDYMNVMEVHSIFSGWLKKLKVGGRIVLGGTDLVEVCKSFADYKIDITEANMLIHGEQTKPWRFKKLNFTAMGLADYLRESFGMKILKKRVTNYKMTVEAQRIQ